MTLALVVAIAAPVAWTQEEEKSSLSDSQIERMHKRKAQEAWARDQKKMKKSLFAEMERDYQVINKKYRDPEIKDILKSFLEKYKNGNRVGCAVMYLAQKSGGADREKYLKRAIKDFSKSYYLDGCNVGGLARLYLASHYKRTGKDSEAEKLVEEIKKDYSGAQNHSGKPIIDQALSLTKS